MGSVFDKAFRKFSEAFEERAEIIYGEPASARA
jgi:coenzyme Q-binding protein COQ10